MKNPFTPTTISFFKINFLIFVSLYVLVLPIQTIKFNLIDGVNIFGYTSPNWVLLTENVLCIIASVGSLVWAVKLILKLNGERKKEMKK